MRSSQTFVTPTVHQNKALQLETTKRALSGGAQHILQCNCCTERQRVHVSFHGLTPLPVTSVIISAGEPAHQLKQNLLAEERDVYVSDLCGSRCPGGVRPSRGGSGHLGRFYRGIIFHPWSHAVSGPGQSAHGSCIQRGSCGALRAQNKVDVNVPPSKRQIV